MSTLTGPAGVVAASLTAFKPDLSIDTERTLAHARWLLANGCDGVLIFGTTGEANSLSVSERLEVIEAIGKSDLPKDKLMIGTGCCAIPDTVALSKAALAAGVVRLLMLPPFYYKNQSEDGLYAAFATAIDRINDPRMKIFLYHFPQMSGVPIPDAVTAKLIKNYPGIVVGMKDSSGDFEHMKKMLTEHPGFELYSGTEKYLLDVLRLGSPGTISATVNVTCAQAAKVYANWKSEDADALQAEMTAQRIAMESAPAASAMKEMIARHTGDSNWRTVRPPFVPISDERYAALEEKLAQTQFRFPGTQAKAAE